MTADPAQAIRELDAIIQSWISTHAHSVSLASTLGNLDSQTRTATTDQLVATLRSKHESTIADLRRTVHQYGSAVKQLDSLHTRLATKPLLQTDAESCEHVAGITESYAKDVVRNRQTAYANEYGRRKLLFNALTKDTVSVPEFVVQWVESKIDYAVEEEYLERLRLVRLARQWRSNQELSDI
ncbi:hypothetical protein FBU59_004799 [Linderina macrospora]|uniref:Uncharacterized protein n=1 Tax=Linderina macrospora TaxID=4868 RepID=A0ACC1J4P1_9FUNG|nr:hypothetical protein FBU59_004799 [Linderina macrospora]